MKENKINKFLYIFMILQPIIDIITSFMTRFINFPITLGIVVRGIIFLISIIYLVFYSKSKYRKYSVIYLGILVVYSIIYFITKASIFSNFSFIFQEVVYMFKYYYTLILLLMLVNLFDEFRPNNRILFKILQYCLFFYCATIVLANITGTAFGTYVGGSGNTGWFYSGNEIGIIVALLFPLMYLVVNKSTTYKCLFFIIPIVLGIEIIGTKTSILGLLLPTFVFFVYYLIRLKSGKFKQFMMTCIIMIIIVCSSPNLPVVQNIKNSLDRYENRVENTEIDEDYSDEAVTSVLLSDRDYFHKKIVKIYSNRDLDEKLFGIGFVNREEINDKNIEKLIEMDYYDIFYRYGVIGFIIYLTPFIWLIVRCIIDCFKIKFKLNVKQLTLGYISGIGLAIALFVGHTLGAPAVSFYLCLCMVMLLYYLENKYYQIEINENKITIFSLHLATGGIEKYISSLCKMLDDKYEIEIISTYRKTDKPAFDFNEKIEIKYLINDYPRIVEFKNSLHEKNIVNILKYGFNLFKLLLLKYYKNFIAICYTNSKYIITTREFHNKLIGNNKNRESIVIATEHNYHNNDEKYIKKLVDSCKNIDYLVLVSKELQEFYSKKLVNTKCIYIPNVLDNMIEYKKHDKINNHIISVGRLAKEKGYLDLIDIVALVKKEIKDIKLDIYGDGPEKEKLINKINELKLHDNIKLHGFCEYNLLLEKMQQYDLYVMTSYTESFGLVLIEAMSRSLPCIAFDDANGAKHLLKNGNGILIRNRNKEEFAKEISALLKNINNLNKISLKGYNSAKKYDIKEVKKEWLDLLKKCGK